MIYKILKLLILGMAVMAYVSVTADTLSTAETTEVKSQGNKPNHSRSSKVERLNHLLEVADSKRIFFKHGMISGHFQKDGVFYEVSGTEINPVIKRVFADDVNPTPDKVSPLIIPKSILAKAVEQPKNANGNVEVDLGILLGSELVASMTIEEARVLARDLTEEANQVFANSNLDVELNIRLIGDIDTSENTVALSTFLASFYYEPGSEWPAWRDKYGLDLVMILKRYQETDGACGTVTSGFDEVNNSVVGVTTIGSACPRYRYVFAHEVGHMFEAFHNRGAYGTTYQDRYHYGYSCGSKATVMSYEHSGRERHMFFSSPERSIDGEACGIAVGEQDAAHNERKVRETIDFKASLRDRPAEIGSVGFAVVPNEVVENDAEISVQVDLNEALDEEVSVELALYSGTAEEGLDFEGYAERIVFAAGETSKVIQLNVLDDSAKEDDESFVIVLENPFKLAIAGDATTTVVIKNDDISRGALGFDTAQQSVAETTSTVTVNVVRNGGSDGVMTAVLSTVDGSAVAGQDYTALEQELAFAEGETVKSVSITINGDAQDVNRTFQVTIDGEYLSDVITQNVTITNVQANTGGGSETGSKSSSGGGSPSVLLIALLALAGLRRKL